jgi:hypothetical protein
MPVGGPQEVGQKGVATGQGKLRQLNHRTKEKRSFFEDVVILAFHQLNRALTPFLLRVESSFSKCL